VNLLKIVQGWVKIKGDTDGTKIGNIKDNLKVTSKPSPGHHLDSFGRLRVSNPITIFEFNNKYDVSFGVYFDTSVANGATVTHEVNNSSRELAITTTTGSKAILQSRRRMEYHNAKSHLFHYTANFHGVQTGVRKRHGLFDENNGIFFETDGTTLYVVYRSDVSGSVVDTRISQANWNGDKLDGTGASGITADPEKQQLFWIDFAWLGTGGIRWGIMAGGEAIIIHEEYFGNEKIGPFMRSSVLPLRSEIEATGTPAAVDTMHVTCGSFDVEGNGRDIGILRVSDIGLSTITINTSFETILLIRINPAYPYATVKILEEILTVTSGNSEVIWEVLFNPTLTGTPTWVAESDSVVQVASNPGSITLSGGSKIDGGYARVGSDVVSQVKTDVYLGFNIAETPDVIAVQARTVTSNSKILFEQKRQEYF